jgi:hypothetical protein
MWIAEGYGYIPYKTLSTSKETSSALSRVKGMEAKNGQGERVGGREENVK